MNKKSIIFFSFAIILLGIISLGFKGEDKKSTRKINVNDLYQYIAVNQIFMWVANNGDGSHDPRTDANGFYWPGGLNATKSAVFQDGLIFGGKIGREIRVNGNTHRQGLQAGKIINGVPDDPTLEKYRVYKINRNWQSLPPGPERDARQKDFEEWPILDGAPYVDVDGDGLPTPGVDEPYFIGDEVLWYVANDMDASRSTFTYGTNPMGLEFQTTIFGFNRTGALGDMVFKQYKIINKGSNVIRDMIVAYWSDTDLGDAGDDYTGCDTSLSLGYTWNGTNNDGIYGSPPPAMGYDFFQGPIVEAGPSDSAKFGGVWRHGFRNLPMTAFALYINAAGVPWRDPQQGVPQGSIEFYNYMQGYSWDGTPFVNPHTGQPQRFVLTGDPETGDGWYEGDGWPNGPAPDDRRHVMASGPFTMSPGDTQEVVVGLIIATGANNKNSVTALKLKDRAAQIAYDLNFNLTPSPDNPAVHAVPQDQTVTLWWETNAEGYHAFDPLLEDTIRLNVSGTEYIIPVDNKYYDFEGYQIWQFKDQAGTDPILLATFDIANDVGEIRNYQYDYIIVNGGNISQEPLISGPNLGLTRYYTITNDAYSNGPLYNGNPYYFAVTAYGYSKYSDPPVLVSPPAIIEVLPGTLPIDVVYPYNTGDLISGTQSEGSGTGDVNVRVIDPTALTGNEYRVQVYGSLQTDDLRYALFNNTTGDTLLWDMRQFDSEFESKPIVDGFQISVQNTGWDSIKAQPPLTGTGESMVRDVVEVKGPGGTELETPKSVFNQMNSTGEWMIIAPGQNSALRLDSVDTRQNIDWTNNLEYSDYEIRFTEAGSEYYITGFLGARPPFLNNPQGAGRVPFEVWNVGGYNVAEPMELREYVKIWDATIRDSMWTQDPATNNWEAIFSYEDTTLQYSEPIPPSSGTVTAGMHKLGNIIFNGSQPATGTVIKVITFKPLSEGDEFTLTVDAPQSNTDVAKQNVNNISVFPNPYFGANSLERDKYQRFVRFTNLPNQLTVRIFSLSGTFVRRLDKDDTSQYLDWDLRNKDGIPVASGMYLAYIEIPGVGSHVMKLAVILETQFIDRL